MNFAEHFLISRDKIKKFAYSLLENFSLVALVLRYFLVICMFIPNIRNCHVLYKIYCSLQQIYMLSLSIFKYTCLIKSQPKLYNREYVPYYILIIHNGLIVYNVTWVDMGLLM